MRAAQPLQPLQLAIPPRRHRVESRHRLGGGLRLAQVQSRALHNHAETFRKLAK
jgi:hypothetical protein